MVKVESYDWGYFDSTQGWVSKRPNSAGGVSVRLTIRNYDNKTVKYTRIYFEPYNSVHDTVSCKITGQSMQCIQYAGYLDYMQKKEDLISENVWYNSDIRGIHIDHIDVEYAGDGTTESYHGNYTASKEETSYARREDNKGCLTQLFSTFLLSIIGIVGMIAVVIMFFHIIIDFLNNL